MSETFGRLIAKACKTLGVSHSELARRIGVAQPRMPEIIRSLSISEALLKRCADALGCDVEVEFIVRQPATQASPVKMTRRKK